MYHVRFLGKPDEKTKSCPVMGNIYFDERDKKKAYHAAYRFVRKGYYPFAQLFHDFEFITVFGRDDDEE